MMTWTATAPGSTMVTNAAADARNSAYLELFFQRGGVRAQPGWAIRPQHVAKLRAGSPTSWDGIPTTATKPGARELAAGVL